MCCIPKNTQKAGRRLGNPLKSLDFMIKQTTKNNNSPAEEPKTTAKRRHSKMQMQRITFIATSGSHTGGEKLKCYYAKCYMRTKYLKFKNRKQVTLISKNNQIFKRQKIQRYQDKASENFDFFCDRHK